MKRIFGIILMLGVVMLGAVGQAQAEPLVAYASVGGVNTLLTFDSATPTITVNRAITGLAAGEALRGIDYRPANGLLYGLTSQSRLVTINPATGVATVVSTLSTSLSSSATFAGVDFNPTVDRLRIVTSSDQNLRVNVDTGATTVDTAINPAARTVSASAYTNNFAGATTTTLYGIDTSRTGGFLVIQTPPNDGTIVDVGSLGLGFTPSNFNGFDISGQTGIAYAILRNLSVANSTSLYTINLATGQATLVGLVGDGSFLVEGLAAPVGNQTAPIPEPATMILLGTGLAGVVAKVRRRRKTIGDE